MFGPYTDYLIPLLKILDDLPRKVDRGENVLVMFEEKHRNEIPEYAFNASGSTGKTQWVYCIYNAKHKAIEFGLIDSPSKGIWHLTEDGHKWLLEHPNATHFIGGSVQGKNINIPNRSSIKKFRSQPLTADISKSKILAREITNIQAYLDGHSSLQPSAEKLCDWVNFCYTFEMYSDGGDLFALISPNEVNTWYYERTKRLAKLCELKKM